MLVSTEEEGVKECAICYETISPDCFVRLNCSHTFCGSCIKQTLKTHNNQSYNNQTYGPTCALCRAPMTSFSVKNSVIYEMLSEHCL